MQKILVVLLSLFLSLSAISQTDELSYTKIVNPGSVYSTPRLCTTPADFQDLVRQSDETTASQVCAYAEEDKWPSAIETLEKRNAGGRDKMKDYNTYYVADIGENAVLLWVPLHLNEHMPEDMRDRTDFLIEIRKDAVILGDKIALSLSDEDNPEEPSLVDLNASGFGDQLASVLADFENGFETIKGELIPKEEDALNFGNEFNSLIGLEGAEKVYLSEVLLSKDLTFVATFGDFSDSLQALRKFYELVSQIDEATFPCCTMVKLDENSSSVITSQSYLPFDINDQMSEIYDNMVLEVEMITSFEFVDLKLKDVFMVVLRVNHL